MPSLNFWPRGVVRLGGLRLRTLSDAARHGAGAGALRGTQPWIRIVTADKSVDDATAARWTVEQSTGQFVALVATGYTPEADAIARLLAWLHNDPGIDAAVLVGTDEDFGCHPSRVESAHCRLLLLRKSGYLKALPGRWPLTAHALATVLNESGVPTPYMTVRET